MAGPAGPPTTALGFPQVLEYSRAGCVGYVNNQYKKNVLQCPVWFGGSKLRFYLFPFVGQSSPNYASICRRDRSLQCHFSFNDTWLRPHSGDIRDQLAKMRKFWCLRAVIIWILLHDYSGNLVYQRDNTRRFDLWSPWDIVLLLTTG